MVNDTYVAVFNLMQDIRDSQIKAIIEAMWIVLSVG